MIKLKKIAVISHVLPIPATSGGEKSIYNKIVFLSKSYECIFIYTGHDTINFLQYKPDIINLGCTNAVHIGNSNKSFTIKLLNILFFKPIINIRLSINHDKLMSILKEYDVCLINIEHLYSTFGINFKDLKNNNIKTWIIEHNIEQQLRKNLLRSKKTKLNFAYYLLSIYEYYTLLFYQKDIYAFVDKIGFLSKDDLLYSIKSNIYHKVVQKKMYYTPPLQNLNHTLNELIIKYSCNNYSTLIYTFNQNYRPNVISLTNFLKNEFRNLLSINKKINLFITGKTDKCDNYLLSLFDKFSTNIKLTGFLSENEYIELIKKSALLVNPILIGSGIKIKNLEAISFGTLVITSNIGAEGIDSPYIFINDNIIDAYNIACKYKINESDYLNNKNFFESLILNNNEFYEVLK